MLLESMSSEPNTVENKEQLRRLLAQLRQRHPEIFSEVSSDIVNARDGDGRTQIEQLILSLSVVSVVIMAADHLFIRYPLDEPGFYIINSDGKESCGPYNCIRRLGSKYTRRGGAGAFGGEQ